MTTAAVIHEQDIPQLPAWARDKLAAQMKSGNYVVVEPDLSGWHFVTHHYLPETGLKEYNRGHSSSKSVAALAIALGQPCVVTAKCGRLWQEQTERRLLVAGATVVRESEDAYA